MFPLPENAHVTLLINRQGVVVGATTNVSPEFRIDVHRDLDAFNSEACGDPFQNPNVVLHPSPEVKCEQLEGCCIQKDDFKDVEQTQGSFNRTV